MAEPTLEERVAALEQAVAELKQKQPPAAPANGKWWEQVGGPMRPDLSEAFDRMVEYGRYFRKTGREAPPEWKPGDPIPEPDESQS
jgi:hypothetical protein